MRALPTIETYNELQTAYDFSIPAYLVATCRPA